MSYKRTLAMKKNFSLDSFYRDLDSIERSIHRSKSTVNSYKKQSDLSALVQNSKSNSQISLTKKQPKARQKETQMEQIPYSDLNVKNKFYRPGTDLQKKNFDKSEFNLKLRGNPSKCKNSNISTPTDVSATLDNREIDSRISHHTVNLSPKNSCTSVDSGNPYQSGLFMYSQHSEIERNHSQCNQTLVAFESDPQIQSESQSDVKFSSENAAVLRELKIRNQIFQLIRDKEQSNINKQRPSKTQQPQFLDKAFSKSVARNQLMKKIIKKLTQTATQSTTSDQTHSSTLYDLEAPTSLRKGIDNQQESLFGERQDSYQIPFKKFF